MTTTKVPTRDTLESVATRIRSHVVDMCAGPEGGHLGGAFSCTEVLTALYFSVLNVDPRQPDDPARDRFLLSKGHAAVALYATLAERGFFPVEELAGYGRPGSRLMGHPVRAGGRRTVDIHVRRLRAKPGSALPLETVRGVGYRLLSADSQPISSAVREPTASSSS
jgi:transketolase N-terminal domain/subunit